MKKQNLLKMKSLKATKGMIDVANKDIVTEKETGFTSYSGEEYKYKRNEIKYARYFRAVVENEILKVAVFTKKSLLRTEEPLFEIFIDKKEDKYITYERGASKWRTAKINMLDTREGDYSLCMKMEWQTEETRRIVNEYFETGKNKNVYEAVLDFQSRIKENALKKKYRSEIEQIDATMKEVPEVPKGFDQWVIKNCFGETLFYERERPYKWPKVFCTHCGKTSNAPGKPEHGKETVCPNCKTKAVYRSWNKQKYVEETVDVAVLQKLNDRTGYILRNFTCRIKRKHKDGWENMEFSKYENIRARLDIRTFAEVELFEYGEYKYTGVDRWCHNSKRSLFYYYNRCFGAAYMYTANLKRELKTREFSNMNLKKIFKGGERQRVDMVYILQRLNQYPCLEYIEKSKLTTLYDEIMSSKEYKSTMDLSQVKINDVLKLDRQRVNRLRECNGGFDILRALQYEKETGEKITDENIRYIIDKRVDIREVETLIKRTGMKMQRMLNYLKRQQEENSKTFREIKGLYNDYLNMAEERGMNLHDEIVCKQSRMIEFHDRYLEEKNREKSEKRDKEVDKKFVNIKADYKKNMERFRFETKEFVIIAPKRASEITKEGRVQHHCVGASDYYLSRMNERKSFILFLRKKSKKNKAYYTLEVDWNGRVIQFYAAYDRQPDKDKIEKVLKEWTTTVKKKDMDEGQEDNRVQLMVAM